MKNYSHYDEILVNKSYLGILILYLDGSFGGLEINEVLNVD